MSGSGDTTAPAIGRAVPAESETTVDGLKAGMDFRRREHRRAVFLRFYEFHLRYLSHPGGVYYVMPFLKEKFQWSVEDGFWWAFLNGSTQNPVTTQILWEKFPSVKEADPRAIHDYVQKYWRRLEWDADRRYWKARMLDTVGSYQSALGSMSQQEFFESKCGPTREATFDALWKTVREDFHGFGRLTAWSYLEYLYILGLPMVPGTLFMGDREGSRSHRNGLCHVLGRNDLDWHYPSNPSFSGHYPREVIAWLEREGEELLRDAVLLTSHPDANYFTLESTLCCYKSWSRPNRRYPNVYNDMMHSRICRAERMWRTGRPIDFQMFWEARAHALPPYLRLELNPSDRGLAPEKQNHYRNTGEVIMMHHDWPCFANNFNGE